MRCNGIGSRCLHQTLSEHLKEPDLRDFSLLRHITDSGITAELLRRHHRPASELKKIKERCLNRLALKFVAEADVCQRVPGSRRLLDALQELEGVSYGVVAHNWEVTARAKLMQSDHDIGGFPFASADDGHSRTQIMMACHDRVAELEDVTRFERVTFIGSGFVDAAAALALGWRFVGVGDNAGTLAMKIAGSEHHFRDFDDHPDFLHTLLQQ